MAEELLDEVDASRRLGSTICRYRSLPYSVDVSALSSTNKYSIRLQPLARSQKSIVIDYRDKDFDYSSPPLGWFSTRGPTFKEFPENDYNVFYLCRRPGRYNNVGLLHTNIDERLGGRTFYSEAMYNCIMGIHPTFEAAKKIFWDEGRAIVPFHRDAAIKRTDGLNAQIVYINAPVANIRKDGSIVPLQTMNNKLRDKLLQKIGVLNAEFW